METTDQFTIRGTFTGRLRRQPAAEAGHTGLHFSWLETLVAEQIRAAFRRTFRRRTLQCWKADYAGPGFAEVWICWYKATGNAFEAMQRARAEAQAVKFQEEHYFILVRWNNVPKVSLTALVRAIEKALQPKVIITSSALEMD